MPWDRNFSRTLLSLEITRTNSIQSKCGRIYLPECKPAICVQRIIIDRVKNRDITLNTLNSSREKNTEYGKYICLRYSTFCYNLQHLA